MQNPVLHAECSGVRFRVSGRITRCCVFLKPETGACRGSARASYTTIGLSPIVSIGPDREVQGHGVYVEFLVIQLHRLLVNGNVNRLAVNVNVSRPTRNSTPIAISISTVRMCHNEYDTDCLSPRSLIHRDYANTAPIQIRVYDNRLCIWNPGVLPESWTVRKLFAQHSSCPYNPLVANAFFRAGEIEAWGRGVQRIVDACEKAGNPRPKVTYDPSDLWFEFPFSPQYLRLLPSLGKAAEGMEWGEKWGEKWGTAMTAKRLLIAKAMLNNPRISIPQLAAEIGMGTTGIEKHLKVLRDGGCVRHVGPTKGGHWEVTQ